MQDASVSLTALTALGNGNVGIGETDPDSTSNCKRSYTQTSKLSNSESTIAIDPNRQRGYWY